MWYVFSFFFLSFGFGFGFELDVYTCMCMLILLGGITNGHDLVIAYLRDHYPALLVNTILAAADITPRPVAYATSATEDTDTVYVVWRVIKAFSKAVVWFFSKK